MSIKNHRYLGKHRNPESKKVLRVYTGTDSETGQSVRFVNPAGSPKIIPDDQFRRWKKTKG